MKTVPDRPDTGLARAQKLLSSSIGAKWVMGLTGLGLLGFVLMHMTGNLLVFGGRAALNGYAQKLIDLGPLLWVARAGLLGMFVLHVASAARVTRANRAARPEGYARAPVQGATTYAARTMLMSGLLVLAFIVYHLLHFTFGVVQSGEIGAAHGAHDVYGMVIAGFSNPVVALSYVVAQIVLAMHIAHGASSAFQTFGLTYPSLSFLKHGFGKLVAGVILVGNLSIPLSILAGVVR